MKVLLVDDDVFLRDMYSVKFSQCGHDIETAASASEALRILENDPEFDVILLDMIMPAMTGVELIKTIKEKLPLVFAKCVVLSNQGQPEDIEAATKAGAQGYIIKADTIPSEVIKEVELILNK